MTPDFYAVNTMQPPYQPSATCRRPAATRLRRPATPTRCRRRPTTHIGDLLGQKGVSWAWYGGAWQAALTSQRRRRPKIPNFQYHHQPLQLFATSPPAPQARAEHLRDGGLDGSPISIKPPIDAGKLPPVTFYKPQGNLNQHAGYTDVASATRTSPT